MKKVLLALMITSSMIACKNDDSGDGSASMKVYITDAPGDYEHIYLEVVEVALNNGGWQTMTLTQPDTFDILEYTNGDQLLLAEGDLDPGTTKEIRLVLGANNSIVLKDGSSYELKVPSGQSSGLKIKLNVDKNVQAGQTYYVVLDFDAAKSVVKTGNGKYQLKPVIRGYWDEGMGAAEGYALPTSNQVSIHAIVNGSDTIGSALTDPDGYYKVSGLPQANYSFYYLSSAGNDTLIPGVQVMQNQTTVVDTVNLN